MKKLINVLIICGISGMITLPAFSQNSSAQNYGAQPTHNYSQTYKTGIGVRLGGLTSGVTVKGFMNPASALEGILSFGHDASIITGLYERYNNIENSPGLRWFYGGGAHIGFFSYDSYYYYYNYHGDHIYVERPGEMAVVAGIDFIIGLDYKFKDAPFSVGVDLKPFVDFHDELSGYWDGALSIRYTF